MPEEPELRARPRSVTVGPFQVSRAPRKTRGDYFHIKVAAAIGIAVTAVHDIAYRQTGGEDFQLFGVISHAGADMLMVTAAIVLTLVLVEWGRIR